VHYDGWVRRALPTYYEEIFATALEFLPLEDVEEPVIADLGAGTGLFAERIASLQDQVRWLDQAGFQADCIYKYCFVAVFLGIKSSGAGLGESSGEAAARRAER
jgi:hypothetical protein